MKINNQKYELNQLAIRIRLAELDKNQAWLASQIGETRQRWHYYYSQKNTKHAPALAKALKVSQSDLLIPKNSN